MARSDSESIGAPDAGTTRMRAVVRGAVQGVGFRPFVFKLAGDLGLTGWVVNSAQGVFAEVEGPAARLDTFLARLEREKPSAAVIHTMEHTFLDPAGYETFEIRESEHEGEKTAAILPDMATCPDCVTELFDSSDRRHRYPFINCTHCGPRYSIIDGLPYDRPLTSMKSFTMCARCAHEYVDPDDRRFHAQANACPDCGPQLELLNRQGEFLCARDDALLEAANAIRHGEIVALKGLGGYHLVVDARNDDAVKRLRRRKHREEKPLALMYPSLATVREHCEVSPLEERLLTGPESPIVLLRRRRGAPVAPSVAPDNPYLGVMLPYTPLHHVLTRDLGFPVVATSGNISEEPICTNEHEALERLEDIADLFLNHDRRIARPVDDSIVRVVAGRPLVIRRARGYAPSPVLVDLGNDVPPTLAVGGQLKNTVAISVGRQVILSQHIGDMAAMPSYEHFRRAICEFERLYHFTPARIARDMHPDYLPTKHALSLKRPTASVQHHYAHVLACMAENDITAPALGVSWDGTGYGTDGTVWGGEFLRVRGHGFDRVGHLRRFRIPGGDRAIRDPRRSALGLLYEIFPDDTTRIVELGFVRTIRPVQVPVLFSMLRQGLHSPITSSAGRLFDAVAGILFFHRRMRFEGQAAMALEHAADGHRTEMCYPLDVASTAGSPHVIDWAPMVRAILDDVDNGTPTGLIAAAFHNTLAQGIVEVAELAGEARVVLTGGCFQNRLLTEASIDRLIRAGFRPYWHQRIPPNDGGIALGQLVAAALENKR